MAEDQPTRFGDARNGLGKEMLKNDGCALHTPIEQPDLRFLNSYWQLTPAGRQPGPPVCCPLRSGRAYCVRGLRRHGFPLSWPGIQNLHLLPVIRKLFAAFETHNIRSRKCSCGRPPLSGLGASGETVVLVRATEQLIYDTGHIYHAPVRVLLSRAKLPLAHSHESA